jgi:glycosyltransferase involved in cell wall biosynthesis
MQVLIALEARFDRTPDGHVWSPGWAHYDFFKRYLDVFDEVCVIARVRMVDQPPMGARRADGPSVSFASLPHYIGPWQFARYYPALRRAVHLAVMPPAAVVLRVPGPIGTLVEREMRAAGRPFAVEVVGDPQEVFGPGSVRTRLRPLFRWWAPRTLRRQCAGACAATYVTARRLQECYPPAPGVFTSGCSDIDLDDDAFVDRPRPCRVASEPWNVVLVGSLEQLYKGPDVLIEAAALCAGFGPDLRITIVGDGKHRTELEALARARGLADRVRFRGELPPGNAVRAELDRADLFVLPSRTEGLPRALIEAMARGLPCIATAVGGVPELLAPSELVPPADARALAAKLCEVLGDAQRLLLLSAANLERARTFHLDALVPRRRSFFRAVKEATLAWEHSRGIPVG